ncbi:MAG TPA: ATP-dependent Clp protease ATP-binding subunit [Candidatus Ornithoclostridium faecigallinarum]|nr:ATP-dependent Clp protease ATP-binding subunit [Candidatus Ornithoclostridium faecigallinarum]
MKFTEECARAIKQAQTYAMRKGGLLGTEHMLAGIASAQCKGGKILARLIDVDALIAALLPQEDEPTSNVRITPRVDRALRSSEMYGKMNGVGAIDSVTLLTCLLEDGGSYACRALASMGVDVEELRARLMAQTMFDRHEEDDGDDDEDDYEDEGEAFGSGLNIDKTNTGAQKTNINAKLPKELQDLGEDLTEKARQGKLDPIIGRSKEIERIIEILCRRTKNNPVLIGEPGVGKSAIVEGLAQAIVNGDVPEMLRGKTVFSLNITSVLSGTKYRGEFEERLKKAIDAILSRGDIIVFIDEIHMIVGAGSTSENGVDAANILKPMLARGEMQTIGATTLDEYRKFIEKDSALERRFQQIIVDPPSVEDTITILKGIRSKYEEHHHVTITDEAIEAAAKMSDRYISDRFLPDKAIDLIDEAASKKRISNFVLPDDVKKMEDEVNRLKVEQVSFAKHELYEEAQEAKVKAAELQRRIDEQKKAWHQKHSDTKLEVGVDDIAAVVSAWTKIPVVKLTESEAQRLLHLEETLHKRVVGQDEAVSAVAKAVRRARAGVQDSKRPIGSFIFLGPTGVGKTELSKALAEAMFGDENMLIRMDMSEYMDKISVSKLIGSAPGYVGYDEGGQLTEKVRRKPYSVVLFDEIEKAHPDVFNILLQILDDGRLTDSHGRTVNFKNTIVIMTSNIGANEIKAKAKLGFGSSDAETDYDNMKERQMEALKKAMRPEFINRIDDVIIFRPLRKEDMNSIVTMMVDGLAKRLEERDIGLAVTDAAKNYIVEHGTNVEYGARPLRRAVQKYIEDELSELILENKVAIGQNVTVDVGEDGALKFVPGEMRGAAKDEAQAAKEEKPSGDEPKAE